MAAPQNNYLPAFEHMRAGEGDAIEVSKTGNTFSTLREFNGIDVATLLARARAVDGSDAVECLRQNMVQFSIDERRKRAAESGEAKAEEAAPAAAVLTHSGFVAKISPAGQPDKVKSIKLLAVTREGYAEKKALVTQMFAAALSAGARMSLTPEEMGKVFAKVSPDGDIGDLITSVAMGMQMQAAQAQAQAMAGNMAGMMGGGGMPGGAAPAECQQQ